MTFPVLKAPNSVAVIVAWLVGDPYCSYCCLATHCWIQHSTATAHLAAFNISIHQIQSCCIQLSLAISVALTCKHVFGHPYMHPSGPLLLMHPSTVTVQIRPNQYAICMFMFNLETSKLQWLGRWNMITKMLPWLTCVWSPMYAICILAALLTSVLLMHPTTATVQVQPNQYAICMFNLQTYKL